jgi:hypothetical protein
MRKIRIQISVAGNDLLAIRRATHKLLDMMIEAPDAPGWAVGNTDSNGVAMPVLANVRDHRRLLEEGVNRSVN